MMADNTVYIGKKGLMSYAMAAMIRPNAGVPSVSIKARGKSIARAVDVAEIVRNRFVSDVKVQNIRIKTDELDNTDGTKSKVSSIEITLGE